MLKISQLIVITAILASIAFPAQAKSRHEMCEVAEMASQVISQKKGDSPEATALKRTAVHNQCFTAPIAEIESAYSYLIDNWDTVFNHTPAK